MINLNQYRCPECGSKKFKNHKKYATKNHGEQTLYRCSNCRNIFSETKGTFLKGVNKPISFIVQALKLRSEGLGFNATCRVLEIAKYTLLSWEKKFAGLKYTLMVYALLYTFLVQLIEGDELYTKIEKNVPVEDCKGWTVVLMERATRFIWALECGKKDRALFLKAIRVLEEVIRYTCDVTLITDGERRYGNILFDICHGIIRSGRRGRPPKALLKDIKVRLKNKGSQRNKKGRKRNKYKAPHREHPDTCQNIKNKDIHANYVEAFNSSLRRRNSAFRRKINTYGKTETGLQRTLDIYWIIHNFVRVHFTTKTVPAVALGILDKGLMGRAFHGSTNRLNQFKSMT